MAVKESVTLDGKAITKLNVVWLERYRRASATLSDGSTLAFEVKVGLEFIKLYGDKRTEAIQDLTWALLNSKAFLFNH